MTRSCPTAGSLTSSLTTLKEVPYYKRRELAPAVGIGRHSDYCGERLGSIVSVSSLRSAATRSTETREVADGKQLTSNYAALIINFKEYFTALG